jgi:hypothetical protein
MVQRNYLAPRNSGIARDIQLFSLAGFGLLMGIGLSAAPALAQPTPSPTPQPEVGFEFEGQNALNYGLITDTEYRGDCPGFKAGKIQARFTSSKTLPAPGQRVVIRNVSRGLQDDPYPFTDRKYDQGRLSEATTVTYGTKQALTTFNVLRGVNDFEYQVKQGDRVIDQGTFQANIQFTTNTTRRRAQCSSEQYCRSGKAIDKCSDRDLLYRTKCTCPDGTSFYR